MFVESILSNKGANVVAVDLEMTATDVAKVFTGQKIGFAVVRGGGEAIIGTITERDIVHCLAEKGERTATALVKDIMTKNIVVCSSADTLPKVMSLMTIRRARHVLVMDDKEMKGVISIGDVVKYRLEESMMDEETLRDYISGMGYN